MWSSNIFWALIFIISKHYAAGGLVDEGIKFIQKVVHTDKREDKQEKTPEIKNYVKGLKCKEDEPYRSINGTCNNLKQCDLGAAGTPYTRYMENSYCDGQEELPCTSSNGCLTSAREISLELYDNEKMLDCNGTIGLVAFGQFIVHDLALAMTSNQVQCCVDGKYTSNEKTNPKCDSIDIPKDDPVFAPAGRDCINFVRSDSISCNSKPAVPVNNVSHYLDASNIYGSDEKTSGSLRTYKCGMLKSAERDNKEWLPQNLNPTQACFNLSPNESCYRAGDVRVNQNAILTLIHIVVLRLHNRVAHKLCKDKLCPWKDEQCFQETRRIVIAILQNIFFKEYLSAILGPKYMNKLNNESCRDEDGYLDVYSCDCNPAVSVECFSAALRGQHSAIPGLFNLYFESEKKKNYETKTSCDDDYFDMTGSIELNAWINKPSIIETRDNSDGLFRSLHVQRQEAVDENFDDEVRHKLFSFNRPFGVDLPGIDVERSRDHGMVTYCKAALACGILTKCDCFDDLKKYISDKHVAILEKIYNGDVCKVELMVAGMVERNVCDGLVGPVFQCILGKQFKNTRCGDRYWYERKYQPYPFTPEQLCNIREYPMASLLCQHGDGIDMIQKEAFKKISKENPLKKCCDLPKLDYSLFKTYKHK